METGFRINRAAADAHRDTTALLRPLIAREDRRLLWPIAFAPRYLRPHLLAIHAFDIELSRIPPAVSDPVLGQIRLQWWRDALANAGRGAQSGHPVADALALARRRCLLPDARLLAMIEARARQLDPPGFASLAEIETFFADTRGNAALLACYVLGERGEVAEEAARLAGVAIGFAESLARLGQDAARGYPDTLGGYLEARGVPQTDLQRGVESAALMSAFADLLALARARHDAVAERFSTLPARVRPALLPAVLAGRTLRRLARPNYRPLHDLAQENPLISFWHLWRAQASGRL